MKSIEDNKKIKKNFIFVHSDLDDYGLSPAEFRVLGHLSRRIGDNSCSWSSIENIAKICKIRAQTVRAALKKLSAKYFLDIKPIPGRTNSYKILPKDGWLKSTSNEFNSEDKDYKNEASLSSLVDSLQKSRVDPSRNSNHEGNTVSKYSEDNTVYSKSELIYLEYPKSTGRKLALKAIEEALAKYPFDKLIDSVKLYSKAVNSWPVDQLKYVPNPATWFNQERYHDDPKTWLPQKINTKTVYNNVF